jgi:Nucleoside diphosphate kinase
MVHRFDVAVSCVDTICYFELRPIPTTARCWLYSFCFSCPLALLSALVCSQVFEGRNAIATGRSLVGATDPQNSKPGSLRGR